MSVLGSPQCLLGWKKWLQIQLEIPSSSKTTEAQASSFRMHPVQSWNVCWCSARACWKAGHILPQRSLRVPCGMWNGEVFFGASLPGCANQVKDQPSLERSRLANLPDRCFRGHEGNNPIQKSAVFRSFQNQLEMSKQHITQPPLYLTLCGHLFPHVGPRDTVSAK